MSVRCPDCDTPRILTEQCHCRNAARKALRWAAKTLEERPHMDPVRYLRECADELEDEA